MPVTSASTLIRIADNEIDNEEEDEADNDNAAGNAKEQVEDTTEDAEELIDEEKEKNEEKKLKNSRHIGPGANRNGPRPKQKVWMAVGMRLHQKTNLRLVTFHYQTVEQGATVVEVRKHKIPRN